MFKNYFKTALRNLLKRKGYTFLNILGLATGMACSLMILLYIQDELSYDRFNVNADQIYRVNMFFRMGGREADIAVIAPPTAQVFINEFPEITDALRFRDRGSRIIQYEDISFKEKRVIFADASFFRVFTIPLIKGNPETALEKPNTLVLSRSTVEKYFGDEEPVGKIVKINNETDYMVTGVYEDIPHNSHFHFDVMLSMASLEESRDLSWLSQNFQTYLLINENADIPALEAKFPDILLKYMGPQVQQILGQTMEELITSQNMAMDLSLIPLKDIHLHSDMDAELEPNSDIKYVYVFSAIAFFILIIASINFMNLSTARASGRAKEVGIRKVLGSCKKDLIKQFLTESMLLSLISLGFAVILVMLALPSFNRLSGKALSSFGLLSLPMIGSLLGVTILTGLFAGSYPAFFISAFQPVNVLKGQVRTGVKTGLLRSGLVVFQFAASIILIIGTIVVYNQLHYIQNKNLGFEKEQVAILEDSYLLGDQAEIFKEEMMKYSQIVNASISGYLPVPSNRNSTMVFPDGNFDDPRTASIQVWQVDYDYIQTMGMKIEKGRNFSRDYSTDTEATIINQQAVKQYGYDDPLGQRLTRFTSNEGDFQTYKVIGVVEDFHFDSLRNSIAPLIMFLGRNANNISFRFKTDEVAKTIELLRSKWKEFLPHQPFIYSFLDERFFEVYETEQRFGKIFGVFAGLAIFIGCLGLFGLASFVAEKRTKEIGIRKVLGATVPNITELLMKEFLILICIANFVAWPVSYFVMTGWLNDFAFRMQLQVWIFVTAGVLTLFIAMLTVFFQSIKAALANPADSLMYE